MDNQGKNIHFLIRKLRYLVYGKLFSKIHLKVEIPISFVNEFVEFVLLSIPRSPVSFTGDDLVAACDMCGPNEGTSEPQFVWR